MLVSNLNLQSQWVCRLAQPCGQYHVDFKLEPKSGYFLIEEANKLETPEEVDKLERGIEKAAGRLIQTIPTRDLESQLSELVRTQIDPTDKSRLFAFKLQNDGSDKDILVTRVEVIKHADKKSAIAENLSFDMVKVQTHEYTSPIIIRFCIDEKSTNHLRRCEDELDDIQEISKLQTSIKRAIGQWAYDNKDTKMLVQGGQFIVKAEDPLSSENIKFKFSVTAVNGKNLVVNQLRVIRAKAI